MSAIQHTTEVSSDRTLPMTDELIDDIFETAGHGISSKLYRKINILDVEVITADNPFVIRHLIRSLMCHPQVFTSVTITLPQLQPGARLNSTTWLAHAMCVTLKFNTYLTEVRLERCGIESDGVRFLAYALQANTTLKDLSLQGNPIDNDGLFYLAVALRKYNHTLVRLDLSYTYIVSGLDGVSVIHVIQEINRDRPLPLVVLIRSLIIPKYIVRRIEKTTGHSARLEVAKLHDYGPLSAYIQFFEHDTCVFIDFEDAPAIRNLHMKMARLVKIKGAADTAPSVKVIRITGLRILTLPPGLTAFKNLQKLVVLNCNLSH